MNKIFTLTLISSLFLIGCAPTPYGNPSPMKLSEQHLNQTRERGKPVPIALYPPVWPQPYPKENFHGWVDIMYDVLPDGSPDNFRVVDKHNVTQGYVKSALKSIRISAFEPQEETKRDLKRRVTFKFESAN